MLFEASMRETKKDLAARLRKLRDSGFECDDGWRWVFSYEENDFDLVRKEGLVETILSMQVPSLIFGFSEVEVDKDEEAKRWVVKQPSGASLCQIPWTHLFDWQRVAFGSNGGDILAALEACCFLHPLTQEEKQQVLRSRPDLSHKAEFKVVSENWETSDPVEEVVESPDRNRIKDTRPETIQTPRSLSNSRKISL